MDTNQNASRKSDVGATPNSELRILAARSPSFLCNSRPFVFIRGFFCMVPATVAREPRLLLFESDVAEFHFHGRTDVDLDAEQAVGAAVHGIVIDEHAHHVPVEDVREDVAAGD